MAMAPEQIGIGIRRYFTEPGTPPLRHRRVGAARRAHPELQGRHRRLLPARRRVPRHVVAERHEHRRPEVLPRHPRHRRARGRRCARSIDRVADTITAWGMRDGYFVDDDEGAAFRNELKYVLVHQRAAFNSPVWFNIGVKGVPQQASACFILAVDDTMDGILNWYREEGIIFKGGSGSGINLSGIRSSREHLAGRRHRQRPGELHARRRRVRGHDQVGRQDPPRREDGHPQRRSPRHRGVHLVQGASRSARRGRCATPASTWTSTATTATRSSTRTPTTRCASPTSSCRRSSTTPTGTSRRVTTGETVKTVKARELMRQISEAAWECADPGMQFDTTINRGTPRRTPGASTPATRAREYMHLDNSACNLASINLLKYLDDDGDVRRRGLQAHGRGRCSPRRRSSSATPTTRPRRSRTTAASSASSGSATPTSARCSWRRACPYDSDEGRAWAARDHRAHDRPRLRHERAHRRPHGPVRRLRRERRRRCSNVLRMHRAEAAKIDEDLVPPDLLGAAQQLVGRGGRAGRGATACATRRRACSRPPAPSA